MRAFLGRGDVAVSTANYIVCFRNHMESTMFQLQW